jgi:ABC-type uncharacterized transport system permease subunit
MSETVTAETLTSDGGTSGAGSAPLRHPSGWVRFWRRVAGSDAVTVTALGLVAALVAGAILMIVTNNATLAAWGHLGSRPGHAFGASWDLVRSAYWALLRGSLGSVNSISETLVNASPLILGGLAVALPFRAGMFNIGAQGQMVLGAIVSGVVSFYWPGLPVFIHLPLALLAGLAGGAAFGWIPGILKARTGAHEVIVTIMLNYVALNLLIYLLSVSWVKQPGQTNAKSRTPVVSARLPHLLGHNYRLDWSIIIAIAAVAVIHWLLRHSTLGFRIRMVGANHDAARAAGVNIRRMIALTMTIGGGLAGLAGATQILGIAGPMTTGYTSELGFTAITVALLGRASPLGTLLGGLLFGALQAGGLAMQAATSVPLDLVQVIQAIIVFFVAAPAVVRDIFRIKSGGGNLRVLSGGWGG